MIAGFKYFHQEKRCQGTASAMLCIKTCCMNVWQWLNECRCIVTSGNVKRKSMASVRLKLRQSSQCTSSLGRDMNKPPSIYGERRKMQFAGLLIAKRSCWHAAD